MSILQRRQRFLEINIPGIDEELLLIHFSGTEALSQCFEYDLTFISRAGDLSNRILFSQSVSFTLYHSQTEPQYFHGLVAAVYQHQPDYDGYIQYRLKLRPKFSLLALNRDSQCFVNQNLVEIVKTVFKNHDLINYDISDLRANYPLIPYCVRYQESVYAFISRLLATHGIFYYFRHTANEHVLVMDDGPMPKMHYSRPLIYTNEKGGDTPHLHTWEEWNQDININYSASAYRAEMPCEPTSSQLRQHKQMMQLPIKNPLDYTSIATTFTAEALTTKLRQRQLQQQSINKKIFTAGNYGGLYQGMRITVERMQEIIGNYYIYHLQQEAYDNSQRGYHKTTADPLRFYGNKLQLLPA